MFEHNCVRNVYTTVKGKEKVLLWLKLFNKKNKITSFDDRLRGKILPDNVLSITSSFIHVVMLLSLNTNERNWNKRKRKNKICTHGTVRHIT